MADSVGLQANDYLSIFFFSVTKHGSPLTHATVTTTTTTKTKAITIKLSIPVFDEYYSTMIGQIPIQESENHLNDKTRAIGGGGGGGR